MGTTAKMIICHLGREGPQKAAVLLASMSARSTVRDKLHVPYVILSLIAKESIYLDGDESIYLADQGDKEFRSILKGEL